MSVFFFLRKVSAKFRLSGKMVAGGDDGGTGFNCWMRITLLIACTVHLDTGIYFAE